MFRIEFNSKFASCLRNELINTLQKYEIKTTINRKVDIKMTSTTSEKQNTLEYVQQQFEGLLEFNSHNPQIEDVWEFVNDPAECPAGTVYSKILYACMKPASYMSYMYRLSAKYSKKDHLHCTATESVEGF